MNHKFKIFRTRNREKNDLRIKTTKSSRIKNVMMVIT